MTPDIGALKQLIAEREGRMTWRELCEAQAQWIEILTFGMKLDLVGPEVEQARLRLFHIQQKRLEFGDNTPVGGSVA